MPVTPSLRHIGCALAASAALLPAGTAAARPIGVAEPHRALPVTAPPRVRSVPSAGFDWPSAGIGAGAIGLLALGAAGAAGALRRDSSLVS
jgi:hypothetical protein